MANSTLHRLIVPMIFDNISILNFDDGKCPEVVIGGDLFSVVAVRKDISVHSLDNTDSTYGYASRVHIDCFPKGLTAHNIELQVRSTAAHVFIANYEIAGDTIANCDGSKIIVDGDALLDATAFISSQPLQAEEVPHLGSIRLDVETLKTRYKAYIDAINARNMSQTLPAFCHDIVTHNGKPLPLVEYQRLMEDAQAVIPDLYFSIASSLVDFDKQILAARLDFRGTPVGEFAGVAPIGGMKKEVRFSEVVFYWFREGKIAQVVSLVDLIDYRKQVIGQDMRAWKS